MNICLRRREFIAGVGGAAAAWPMEVRAQRSAVPVVGWFSTRNAETDAYVLPAFRRGLIRQGYVEVLKTIDCRLSRPTSSAGR